MKMVLDSGALVALDKGDPLMWRRLKMSGLSGIPPVTHGGVIGQVWRGVGPRQARLAKALAGIEVVALDNDLGRSAGELLRVSKTSDVIDAAIVLLADRAGQIFTSDIDDLRVLAEAAGLDVELVPV